VHEPGPVPWESFEGKRVGKGEVTWGQGVGHGKGESKTGRTTRGGNVRGRD